MKNIKSIISIELLRMRRNYMVWFLFFCAASLLFLMDLFNYFSIEEQVKMIKDFSLGLMNLTALVLVLFYPIFLIKEEFDNRFIYNLLSKPVSRTQIILGKMGAVVVLVAGTLIMNSISLGIMLQVKGVSWDLQLTYAVFLIFLKNTLLISFAALFGLLPINAFLGTILTLLVYCLGSVKTFLLSMGGHLHANCCPDETTDSVAHLHESFSHLLLGIIPNFHIYDLVEKITLGTVVPFGHIINCLLHFTGVTFVILGVAVVVFNRREV